MQDILLAAEFSGYISIIKFAVFLVLFFLWVWLISWTYEDSQAVGTKEHLWTAVILATGAVAALLWLIIPVFFVGLLLYLIAAGAAAISYVMHRNSLVPQSDKVLTAEHIKGLFENQQKQLEELENITFITANKNEVDLPEPKTPEFFGFKTAHDLFSDAIYRRTSDVILLPSHESYKLYYIVDGVKMPQPDMQKDRVEILSVFLKQIAALDLEEKRKPQKGTFKIAKEQGTSQWQLSTAGSTAGEQIKLKQITQEKILSLAEINLLPDQYEQLNSIAESKKGLFLISGPPESGVTTTFYSLVRNHDAFINGITTLETNPTAELPNITQEVFSLNNSGTTTYAKKLLTIARMSPDILGVADIKDADTAKIACQAAKESSIVYATIEADSVINAIGKWIKLVGDRKLLARTIIGVSNQRLFRKLCPDCKQAYEPKKELLKKFNIPPKKVKVLYRAGKVIYDKRGKSYPCETCQETGFYGRTCVFETIVFNDKLKKAIYSAKNLQDITTYLRKAKMKYLQEQMLERVLDGTTSINEMIRVISGPASGEKKK